MAVHINSHLAAQLEGAYRLTQTLVLRSKSDYVFTIEVGESLFCGSHPYGAKVTLLGERTRHLGVCQGATADQVVNSAQQMVSQAISDLEDDLKPRPARRHAPTPALSI
jgi:hypothetical protein